MQASQQTYRQIKCQKDPDESIPVDEQTRVQNIIDKHPSAFSGIGLLKDEEVSFHIDQTVPLVASPYRPVPLAYRKKLSAHLQSLREENKIEDVDPNDHCPWISNVVITEKKQKGQIRMNIDMREANKALHRTKRHIETIQEIRHKLQGATRFSEMDMGTTRSAWQKIQGILAHSKLTKGYTDSKSCSLGLLQLQNYSTTESRLH